MKSQHNDVLVGLVGFGLGGRAFHAPIIERVPGLRLRAVVQRTGDSAAQAYPDARLVRSVEELLTDDRIGLVVISTPTPTHAPLATQCLEAGRHVVIDKPMASTASEALALIETARRCQRLLTVYQNRRWDGDFLTVQRLVEQQTCGRLVLIESRFDRYRPKLRGGWREQPRPGAGILFDLGSHLMDQALTLFGLPEAITADVRIERDDNLVDDAFDITLHYPGHRVLLRSTMLTTAPAPRFVVQGTMGCYVKYHMDPQEARLVAGDSASGNFWDQEPRERWGTLSRAVGDEIESEALPTEAGDYRVFYQNVRDAIWGTASLAVTAEQAANVIQLLELAKESSRQRRTLETTRSLPMVS